MNYTSLLSIFLFLVACTPENSTSTNDSNIDSTKTEMLPKTAIINEDQITAIEKQFNLIEGASEYMMEKRRYTSGSDVGDYVQIDFEVYYETKDRPIKLKVIGGEETIRLVTTYYFQDGNLIFEHNEEEGMEEGIYYQNKIYYHNREILKVIEKKADQGTTFAGASFQDHSTFVKNKVAFQQNQQKIYLQYMSYLEKSEIVTD